MEAEAPLLPELSLRGGGHGVRSKEEEEISIMDFNEPDSCLANQDLKPVPVDERSFSLWDIASLWIGLTINIPVYYLAGSLVDMGMVWWEGVLTVIAANSIIVVTLILNAHAGTKYGVPFPVFARASFGLRGAHIPTLSRALVACVWFGIETWIGGQAIFILVDTLALGSLSSNCPVIPWLGTSIPELAFFGLFWLLQVAIAWNGIGSVQKLEKYAAPTLIVLSLALLAWAYTEAGGLGPMLSTPSQFGKGGAKEGQFWQVFFPALTANIGMWATLSLNISDFSRYAKTQKDQILGQAGLPIYMGAFTFVGLAVTSATQVIYGETISSPVILMARIGGVLPKLLALFGITLATITTNIAANIVAPANALSNLNPHIFSFRRGALITALIGVLSQPWRYLQSSKSFVNTWLLGYSSIVGPLGGILVTDYHIFRGRHLDIDGLYSSRSTGPYWYYRGFNINAIMALLIGVLPNLPGFLYTVGILTKVPIVFQIIYNNAWFSGFFLAGFAYWIACVLPMRIQRITSNYGIWLK